MEVGVKRGNGSTARPCRDCNPQYPSGVEIL